jgi:hypothetical protein
MIRIMLVSALTIGLLVGMRAHARADDLLVKLVSITDRVLPGGTVVLVIETQPAAVCEGARQGHYGNEYSINLPSHTMGADGRAQWKWSVLNGSNPIGDRGVRVTCTADGKSGSLAAVFSVR